MINMRVITLKDIFKFLVKILIVSVILFFIANFIQSDRIKSLDIFAKINVNNIKKHIGEELPDISKSQEQKIELSSLPIKFEYVAIEEKETNIDQEDNAEEINTNEKTTIDTPDKAATEVIQTGIEDRFTNEYNGVKIKNGTDFELTESMLEPNIEVDKKNVLIYHTHTCESYTPTENYNYEQTGNYRTTDLNFSVARVGDELENNLKNYGINVVHDKTYHDYPEYTGSYGRSLETVNNMLNNTKADIIIDLHRDAIGSDANYAPMVKIGDEYAAQLMFVIGSSGGGLLHDNWNQNLKFAVKVQEKANQMYPGLFKSIVLRNSRYNQHVAKAATIIEVGATGNTMEQCMVSMKYLAKVIDSF